MALSKGTNSYATVEEADAYFADRLDVDAWTSASAEQKAQALITATSMLDGLSWTGVIADEAQSLSFPRSGDYFDPRLGYRATFDENVPTRIIQATYELAYHLLNNDGLMDETGSVASLEVGSVKLTGLSGAGAFPQNVTRLINVLKRNGGANTWWRAN